MSNKILEEFCQELEKSENPFEFKIIAKIDEITISVAEFIFYLYFQEKIFTIETEEEFLKPLQENFNQKNIKDIKRCIQVLNEEYSKITDDSPLYKNEDVFELENDNHDIKFLDRFRFKDEDFNIDLLIYVADYLPIKFSKKFYEIGNTDTIWKKFCGGKLELKFKTFKEQYIHSLIPIFSWDYTPFQKMGFFVERIDKRTIEINVEGCLVACYLLPVITSGIAEVTIQSFGMCEDFVNYIGVVNEKYEKDLHCFCECPVNAFIHLEQSAMISKGIYLSEYELTTNNRYSITNKSIIKLKVDVEKQELYINDESFKIFGKSFQFVVGCCREEDVDTTRHIILSEKWTK